MNKIFITLLMLAAGLLSSWNKTTAQQTGTISGTIIGKNNMPVESATVSLFRSDSIIVKAQSDVTQGVYSFGNLSMGKYFVSVSMVGYRKAYSEIVELDQQHLNVKVPPIALLPVSKELGGVTVVAKRPFIEQKIDRTIVNVESSITTAGTTALEVLEQSPGVSVDKDGNISLKGKDGVLVLVDGRPTQLGGADLANMLRGVNSNQLDQIEIMTNPPAKYDAAGNAGIINIKTKKIIKSGLNGSANISYGQGRYPKTTEGFNFNYREGKLNLFTNLSHNYQKRFSTLYIDRKIFNNSSIDKFFNQETNRVSNGNNYNAKFGVDFLANKQTTFGGAITLGARDLLSINPNVTKISNASKELETITNALVDTKTDWNSFNANLNFRRLIDKKGKEITSDIDYVKHSMRNDLSLENSYVDANGNAFAKADTLIGILPQDINLYSARVDYLQPLKNKGRFEAGLKSSFVETDNDARYDSIQYGKIVHDFTRSNHFIYNENINAAYVNWSTNFSKKISAQFGLRLENTNATGKQLTTGETFNRQYTQLFPTAYLQYEIDEKNILGANMGRRVSRPSYQSLNPFIRFLDRYTFSQGNPALKPSVSNNFELSHSWKNQITTTINYTYIKDIIHEIILQRGQEAYNTPSNVSSLNQVGIAITASNKLTKWWSSNLNMNLFHDSYKGTVSGASIDRSATSFTINGTQQFKLNKTLAAELNGRYRSGILEGVMRVKPMGVIGAGLSQQVWKNKGVFRLTARDIFWTQRARSSTRYANVDVDMRQISETQVVTIALSYSFSKGKKISPIKRTEGSANEEQNRIGN